MKKTAIGVILTALLAGGSFGGYKIVKDNQASTFENSVHTVVRVIDGDTIDIENETRIRLLGIDSPERKTCFYQESKDALKALIEGKDIRIEKDISGSDKYDRLLRYVYVPADNPEDDDVFVNEYLIRQGFAMTFAVAPDNRYRDLLARAQEEAQKNNRGLWSDVCQYLEEFKSSPSLREKNSEPPSKECTIKGNISEKAYGRLYFTEGCPNYSRIKIDERKGESWFCSAEEAEAAGFTRSASCDNAS